MKSASVVDLSEDLLREMPLPMPSGDSDKESRGRVVVVGGSAAVPGAVILTGTAALRAGAGKVQLAVPKSLARPIGVAFLEAGIAQFSETQDVDPTADAWADIRDIVQNADAVVIGPGFMNEQAAGKMTQALLKNVLGPVFVIDALALTGLADAHDVLAEHAGRIILTPHAGEMAKFTARSKEEITEHASAVAHATAQELGCTVVLKGATTFIATGEVETYRHAHGAVGLATAGSGDVLAGAIAGFAARGADARQASAWGVYVHAQCGARLQRSIGTLGLLAREIADEIPRVLMQFSSLEHES
ncbi:MAG: NAD(P)H-hydrate dehydratase [Povalibacter sp.]